MFTRFSTPARSAVVAARDGARAIGSPYVGTEHLLLGLLAQPDTTPARMLTARGLDHHRVRASITALTRADDLDAGALRTLGIDLAAVRERTEAVFGRGALDRRPHGWRRPGRHTPFSPRAKRALELALREAERLDTGRIDEATMLLGLLREGRGMGCRLVVDAGIDLRELRRDLDTAIRGDAAA